MIAHHNNIKHDGISRAGLALYEERLAVYIRDNGVCRSCGKRVGVNEFEIAHLIANTKCNRKRFGDRIIDHRLNKATTHAGRCNDAQNIGNNPGKCAELVRQIEEAENE